MALNRSTSVQGHLEIKEGLLTYVEFNYNNNEAPVTVSWNYTEDEARISGEFDVKSGKITNYSVSGGIADGGTLKLLIPLLSRIKKEYNTI